MKKPEAESLPAYRNSPSPTAISSQTLSLGPKSRFPASFDEGFLRLLQILACQGHWMAQETQIVELSGLSSEQIARRVLDILNESRIDRFTLLLRHAPRKSGTLLQLQGLNTSTDKSYRTSHFAILHRSSSVSNNESITSSCQTLSPLGMALRMYALGQHAQALDMLIALREEGETGKEILVGIANCKFHLAHYEEAVALYRSILTHHLTSEDRCSPEVAQLYNNLGSAYARLNLQKPSMNAFSQAIEIYHMHPLMDCSPLYSNIAGIYLKAGMPAAAEGYYLKALAERKAKRPGQKELLLHCYRRLAKAQAQLGKYEDAESHLSKASKLAQGIGGLEETLKEEAALREEQGKWQQAIDFYEKLHVLHEQQDEDQNGCKGELYENASRIYQCMGKSSEHRKYLDKAVKQYRKSGNLAKLHDLQNVGKLQVLTQSLKGNL